MKRMRALYVSAYYEIGRHLWEDEFRVESDSYTRHIERMLLSLNIVIYLEEDLYKKYKAKHPRKVYQYNAQVEGRRVPLTPSSYMYPTQDAMLT
jgi:hypothetical protein